MDTPKIVVLVDGGLVQDVIMNDAAKKAKVQIAIADYDTEGSSEEVHHDEDGDAFVTNFFDHSNSRSECAYLHDILEAANPTTL